MQPKALMGLMPWLLTIALAATPARAVDPPKVVVMPIKSKTIKGDALAALNDLLAVYVSQLSQFKVMTPDDIEAQLGREGMKQMMGCDAAACAAEIGGALGSRYLVAGAARKLGGKILVTLSLIDTEKGDTLRGKALFKNDEEKYPEAMESAVRELLQQVATAGAVAGAGSGVPARGPEMVRVAAGEFPMGCNEVVDSACGRDELPRHVVDLSAFYIDRTEVTVAQFQRCVDDKKCDKPKTGSGFNWGVQNRGDHPVNGVSWKQAQTFCEWAGKRLPSEAEWEKAARGSDGRTYPWGEKPPSCERAVINEGGWGCGTNGTAVVGSKPGGASPSGALDMAGNVAEWTADHYESGYYIKSPKRNPRGPSGNDFGSDRAVRGGGLVDTSPFFRAAKRTSKRDYTQDRALGFRCARDGS